MYTVDESGFEVGWRRPACLAGSEAEAKRLAAWRKAWDNRIRCCGVTRTGEQCRNVPIKGKLYCMRHGGGRKGAGEQGIGRQPSKKPPTALAEHAREMRRLWRADPWAVGYTVELDPGGQQRLESWAASVGIRFDWLSPRVQNFARWGYVNLCRSGRHPDDDAYASDTLAERIRTQDSKDGLAPAGGHANRAGASRHFARFRAVPPVGEAAPGWQKSMKGKRRRVVQLATMERARDLALIALSSCESREQAIQRQLSIERERLRQEKQADFRPDVYRPTKLPVDRDGW